MKKRIITSLVVAAIIAAGCGSTQPGAGYSYVDDIYYNPRTDPQKEEQKYFTERATLDKETQKVSDQELAQKQREYGNKQTPNQNTDFDAVQQNYANILANDSIIETDTLLYTNDETGYWVDGFEGSDMDRDYAERIVRFHGPFMGVPYGSPLYTDLVYGNYWDWNVYVDGNYAWAVPTWSNSLYYNYYSPGWSLSFGWGWPYYNSYGYWGGYYGYNSWYGMGYPPYNGYYGGHHHGGYHNGYNGGGRNYTNEVPRRGNATNHSYTPNNTQYNNNPRESMKSTTTRTVDAQGNRTISNGQTTYTRPTRESYNQNAGTTTKSSSTDGGTQQVNDRAVRRSYTPTYSAPQNTSRPTYNRTAPSQQRSTTAPRSLGTGTSTGSTPAKSATQPTGTRYQSTGTSNSRPASSGTSSPSYSRPERSTSVSSPSSSSPSRSSGGYDNSGGSRSTSSPSSGGSSSGGSSSGGGASRPSRR